MSENWELIDAYGGVKTFLGTGTEDDTVLVRREFSAATTTAALDRNKAMQSESFDRKSDMWHAASIPAAVIYEWITKFGVNFYNPAHADGVKRLLNSSDYRWCKVKDIIL